MASCYCHLCQSADYALVQFADYALVQSADYALVRDYDGDSMVVETVSVVPVVSVNQPSAVLHAPVLLAAEHTDLAALALLAGGQVPSLPLSEFVPDHPGGDFQTDLPHFVRLVAGNLSKRATGPDPGHLALGQSANQSGDSVQPGI